MPKIGSQGLEQHKLTNDQYGYSAIGIGELGATEYTLASLLCDRSGSVDPFEKAMEACLKEIVKACQHSPRVDNLMLRLLSFSNDVKEIHGFKPLADIKLDEYDGCLHCGGETALYDAAANAIKATADYAKQLTQQDYGVNAIIFVITDGDNNAGKASVNSVKNALIDAKKSESLQDLTSILIAVNAQDCRQFLDDFHQKAGFTQFVDVPDAKAGHLARLAAFVSKSVSAKSNSLGSKTPSKLLTF